MKFTEEQFYQMWCRYAKEGKTKAALTHELAYFSFFPTPTSRPLPFSAFRAVIASKAGVGRALAVVFFSDVPGCAQSASAEPSFDRPR